MAVTVVSAVRVTSQLLALLQPPPLQPVKSDPSALWGVRVTVPGGSDEVQVPEEQFIPAGMLVTEPAPFPAIRRVNRGFMGGAPRAIVMPVTPSGAVTTTGDWLPYQPFSMPLQPFLAALTV